MLDISEQMTTLSCKFQRDNSFITYVKLDVEAACVKFDGNYTQLFCKDLKEGNGSFSWMASLKQHRKPIVDTRFHTLKVDL